LPLCTSSHGERQTTLTRTELSVSSSRERARGSAPRNNCRHTGCSDSDSRLNRRRRIFLPRLRTLARVISMTRIQENPVVCDRAATCGLRQRHVLRTVSLQLGLSQGFTSREAVRIVLSPQESGLSTTGDAGATVPDGTLQQQLSYWTNFGLLCHSAGLAIPWLPSSQLPSSPDVPG
jgi:hypothetical protein